VCEINFAERRIGVNNYFKLFLNAEPGAFSGATGRFYDETRKPGEFQGKTHGFLVSLFLTADGHGWTQIWQKHRVFLGYCLKPPLLSVSIRAYPWLKLGLPACRWSIVNRKWA
jgi:hypothetical protein